MSKLRILPPNRSPLGLTLVLASLLALVPSDADAQRQGKAKAKATESQVSILRSANVGAVGRFRTLAKADPFLGQQINSVLRDKARLINTPNTSRAERQGREAYVPYASSRPMRKVMVRSILKEMNSRSVRLKSVLKAEGKKKAPTQFFDTIFVGAGVHTAIGANALAQSQPSHKMLVIEAGKYVSANFMGLGQGLAINSSSRAENNLGVQPFGRGNNNPTTGPLQVPDISGSKYPAADALSDVATINLHSSGADVITQSRVTKVEARTNSRSAVTPSSRVNWPAKYRVTTNDGVVVFTNNIVVGSGLGKPNIKLGKTGNAYLKAQLAKLDYNKPNQTPNVLFYEQAMALANISKTPRDAYRSKKAGERAPTVMVVGGGDSGRTFLELLFGQARRAYSGPGKLDVAQRGDLGNIKWVVGPNGPKDCPQFLNSTRARYLKLTGEVRSGKADLIADGVKNITEIKSGKNKGRTKVTYSSGKTTVVDKVVFATGYRSQVADFLKPVLPQSLDTSVPLNSSRAVSTITTKEVKGTSKKTPVAKQIKNESIYLVGPAAGTDLVRPDQIRSTNENTAAIKFLGPATAGLSRGVLAKYHPVDQLYYYKNKDQKKRFVQTLKPTARRFDTSAANEKKVEVGKTKSAQSSKLSIARTRGKDPLLSPERTGLEAFVMKLEMSNVLDGFTFPGRKTVALSFSPEKGSGVRVRAEGMSAPGFRALKAKLEANGDLTRQIQKVTKSGKSLTFSAKLDKRGEVQIESLQMLY